MRCISLASAHNRYQSPYIPSNEQWRKYNARKLKGEPVILDAARRAQVDKAIGETCILRGWRLLAINVRTNHVHIVVAIGDTKPQRALNAFKANATRQMRQASCWSQSYSPWVDKGSKRYLWNERSIERAIDYVINGQGDELPDFDS